jgi:hypothetical protein
MHFPNRISKWKHINGQVVTLPQVAFLNGVSSPVPQTEMPPTKLSLANVRAAL